MHSDGQRSRNPKRLHARRPPDALKTVKTRRLADVDPCGHIQRRPQRAQCRMNLKAAAAKGRRPSSNEREQRASDISTIVLVLGDDSLPQREFLNAGVPYARLPDPRAAARNPFLDARRTAEGASRIGHAEPSTLPGRRCFSTRVEDSLESQLNRSRHYTQVQRKKWRHDASRVQNDQDSA